MPETEVVVAVASAVLCCYVAIILCNNIAIFFVTLVGRCWWYLEFSRFSFIFVNAAYD